MQTHVRICKLACLARVLYMRMRSELNVHSRMTVKSVHVPVC